MKKISFRLRTLFFVVIVFIGIILLNVITEIRHHERALEGKIISADNIMSKVFKNTTKETTKLLESYSNLFKNDRFILEDFRNRDRNALFEKAFKIFSHMENHYGEKKVVVHFHLPEHKSFLRLHDYNKHSDDLGFRPIVKETQRLKVSLKGYEIGIHGIFNRIVSPLFYDKEFIGSFEVGLNVKYYAEQISKLTGMKYAILVSNLGAKNYSKSNEVIGNKVVIYKNVNFPIANINFKGRHSRQQIGDKNFRLHHHSTTKTYESIENHEIDYLFFQDLTSEYKEYRSDVSSLIASQIFTFFFVVFIINYGFKKTIGKLETDYSRKSRDLVASEAKYRGMFDNMSEGFVYIKLILDKDGNFKDTRLLDINKAFGIITEIEVKDLLNKNSSDVLPGLMNTSEDWNSIYKDILRNNVSRTVDVQSRRTSRWYQLKVFKISTLYMGITVQDITHVKQKEKELKDNIKEKENQINMQNRILVQESKLSTLGEMFGALVHQWKQPLNTLALQIQYLEELKEEGEDVEPAIDFLMSEGLKNITFMSDSIYDFLDFIKPEKCKSTFILNKNINSALSFYKNPLKQSGVSVKLDMPDEDIVIVGFKNGLKHVIVNIIGNALYAINEYMKCKEFEPAISISLKELDSSYEITIDNNGGQIPEHVLPRIFEANFTTKGEQGSGIGLYSCKTIMENYMNGSITAENLDGSARFIINIPKNSN